MFCRYCGNELPPKVKFCIKCGKSAETEEVLRKRTETQDDMYLNSEEKKKIKRIYRNAWLMIFAILFALLIIVFVLLYIKTDPHIDMNRFMN